MCSPSSAGKPACSYAHTESNDVGSSLRERDRESTERSGDRQRIQLPRDIQDNIAKLNLREKKRMFIYIEILTGEDSHPNRAGSTAPVVRYKSHSDLNRFLFNPAEKTSCCVLLVLLRC